MGVAVSLIAELGTALLFSGAAESRTHLRGVVCTLHSSAVRNPVHSDTKAAIRMAGTDIVDKTLSCRPIFCVRQDHLGYDLSRVFEESNRRIQAQYNCLFTLLR